MTDPTPTPAPVPPALTLASLTPELFLAFSARLGVVPSVRQCLSFAQSQWKDPAADQTGQTGNREFPYAKLEAYLDEARRHLNILGCSIEQPWCLTHDDEGNPSVVLTTTITGPAGDSISETLAVPVPEGSSIKDLGGHGTYMRRYMAMAILGFGKDEDADSNPDIPANHARGTTALPAPRRRQGQPQARPQPQPRPQRARNLDDFEQQAQGGGNGQAPPPADANGAPAAGNGAAPAEPAPLPRLEKVDGAWFVRSAHGLHAKDRVTVTSPRTGQQREVELVTTAGSREDGTEDWKFREVRKPAPAANSGQTAQENA